MADTAVLLQTVNKRNMGMHFQRTITVLLVVYVFDFMADTYKPRPDMPKDLPLQIYNARKALQLIDRGEGHMPLVGPHLCCSHQM